MKNPLWAIPALLVVACQPEAENTTATGNRTPPEESAENQAPKEEEPQAATFDVNKTDTLVGQPFEKVEPALEAAGKRYRVVERDGESFPVTMDYFPERLNLRIKDGIIIAVSKG